MANRYPLFASPIDAEKHPFQIDGLVGVLGSCQMSPMGFVGFFVRLDMPGVPRNGFRNFVVTFNATAPKKESFPFDESERVYVGYLNVNRNPLVIPVQVIAQNGSFLMLFPATEGGLYFMPLPRSASAQIALQGAGTSSGNSIDEAEGILDKMNLDAINLERSGKYGLLKISSTETTKGSTKTKRVDSSRESIDKAEGSAKFEQGKGPFGKPIDKADEESAPVDSSPTKQSSHEVPEAQSKNVSFMVVSASANAVILMVYAGKHIIIRYCNRLKIKGLDGVCEKRVVQEDGRYSLYLSADLPGLDPYLCVTTDQERCVLVYGKPQPQEYYVHFRGIRNYLFFVQLRCSCCKFDNVR
ncbi:hypothetical protein Cgig2_018558 [Carnegiea gigantea]|uniref:Uncharacterized protein n=1 Tax=Carnegiea gigantea TaxID=171969 RepID=A0A9Q1QKH4_9CARY|nr:hypothetical protein Cgig2_018558 [Carnegiea gigantea]